MECFLGYILPNKFIPKILYPKILIHLSDRDKIRASSLNKTIRNKCKEYRFTLLKPNTNYKNFYSIISFINYTILLLNSGLNVNLLNTDYSLYQISVAIMNINTRFREFHYEIIAGFLKRISESKCLVCKKKSNKIYCNDHCRLTSCKFDKCQRVSIYDTLCHNHMYTCNGNHCKTRIIVRKTPKNRYFCKNHVYLLYCSQKKCLGSIPYGKIWCQKHRNVCIMNKCSNRTQNNYCVDHKKKCSKEKCESRITKYSRSITYRDIFGDYNKFTTTKLQYCKLHF